MPLGWGVSNPPVIHRDIKPSNILLGERSGNSVGQVYLVDFGSVQTALGKEEGTRTVVGAYGYMPPEQFGGRTVTASDLYSLGATLIYLLTGTHPADLPQKDFRIQFEPLVNLSPALAKWLKSLTEPSLERRVSSAQEALNALQQPPLPSIGKLAVSKPLGSKIELSKDDDLLDIVIPPVGFQPSTLYVVLFAGFWNFFILSWTIGALLAPLPVNIPFVLFSLPFWWAGYTLIYNLLFGLFGHIKVRLVDSHRTEVTVIQTVVTR